MKHHKIEWIKIRKKPLLWILIMLYFIMAAISINQFVLNEASGVVNESITTPHQIVSLFLFVSLLYVSIFSVWLGSHLGGEGFQYNTYEMLLSYMTPREAFKEKLKVLVGMNILIFLGILMSGYMTGSILFSIVIDPMFFSPILWFQLLCAVSTSLYITWLSFSVSFLLRSSKLGGTMVLSVLMIATFFSGTFPFLKYFSPQWYLSPLYARAFKNINGGGIAFIADEKINGWFNMLVLWSLVIVITLVLRGIAIKREYI